MWAIQVPSVRIGRSCCPCEPEEKAKTDSRDRSNQAKAYTHILGPFAVFVLTGSLALKTRSRSRSQRGAKRYHIPAQAAIRAVVDLWIGLSESSGDRHQ